MAYCKNTVWDKEPIIIIRESTRAVSIYYTHWRATKIAQDLALGPKGLEAFIKQFDPTSEMLSYPWLEGVIYLDKQEKRLIFWESEDLALTSVREAYLQFLQDIWQGWQVVYAMENMYTIEKELGINYVSNQIVDFDYIINTKMN